MGAQIVLKNVWKIFEKPKKFTALQDVSLEINPGEFVLILGPTGSGKTTLLNVIAGIERPSRGTVLIENRNLADLSEEALAEFRRRNFGIVFQFFNLLPHLTALENVMVPLLVEKELSIKRIRQKATKLLEELGLAEKLYHYPRELSGGEQQRVAIARAIISDPKIIIGDEPIAHLDEESARMVLDIFRRLNREGRTIIIATTHEALVRMLQDVLTKVVRLRNGRIANIRVLRRR